jgi:hypothetical protein
MTGCRHWRAVWAACPGQTIVYRPDERPLAEVLVYGCRDPHVVQHDDGT